jgi:hypothetical protein
VSIRLSDAERDGLIDLLRRHLTAGRIDLDEFERRAGVVYAASTREEADAVLDDLPMVPAPARPARGKRHGESEQVHPTWRPTGELFRDPTTHRVMRVWVDRGDASRHYVAEPDR